MFDLTVHTVTWICLYPYPLFIMCAQACVRTVVTACVALCQYVPQWELEISESIKAANQWSSVRAVPEFIAPLAFCHRPHLAENKGSGGWHWLEYGENEGREWEAKDKRGKTKTLGIKRPGRDRNEKGMKAYYRVFPALKGFFGCAFVHYSQMMSHVHFHISNGISCTSVLQ